MKLTDELLPCPFCGNIPFVADEMDPDDWWYVACQTTGCILPVAAGHTSTKSAIDKWNRRAAAAPVVHRAAERAGQEPVLWRRWSETERRWIYTEHSPTDNDRTVFTGEHAYQPLVPLPHVSDAAAQPETRECRHCGWMCQPNSTPSKSCYPLSKPAAPQPDSLTASSETLRAAIENHSRFAAGLAFGLAHLARKLGMGGAGSMQEAMAADAARAASSTAEIKRRGEGE